MSCEQELQAVTTERDQLLSIVAALFDVVTPEQFAQARDALRIQGVDLPG